jgi:hypothetical protein
LFFRDGNFAFVRHAVDRYTDPGVLGRRYVRHRIGANNEPRGPRSLVAGMAAAAWGAVETRYLVAGVKVEVFDPYRLFWKANGGDQWTLQFFATRAGFVAARKNGGGVVVGELKGNFARSNQRHVLEGHGHKMRQVIINAFLVSLVYRVTVTHIALVCVNRAHEVFIVEHPFDTRNAYIRGVLEAFLRVRSAFVNPRGMYSEFDALPVVDRLHFAPWRLAEHAGRDPTAPGIQPVALPAFHHLQRPPGAAGGARHWLRWWYAKQLGWVRVRIETHRNRGGPPHLNNHVPHYCVHFRDAHAPHGFVNGGLYQLIGGAAAFPGAGFMHFFPGGDPRPNMPFVDYVNYRRYPDGETVHQHAARLRLCASVSSLAGRAAALVACGANVAPIVAVFPSITDRNDVVAPFLAVAVGQHGSGQRAICAHHVEEWRMRQRVFIRVLHEKLNELVRVQLNLGNFPANVKVPAQPAPANPNGFRSLSQRPYWNAQLKAKAEVELLPLLAPWLIATAGAAAPPLFGVGNGLHAFLQNGALLRPP